MPHHKVVLICICRGFGEVKQVSCYKCLTAVLVRGNHLMYLLFVQKVLLP